MYVRRLANLSSIELPGLQARDLFAFDMPPIDPQKGVQERGADSNTLGGLNMIRSKKLWMVVGIVSFTGLGIATAQQGSSPLWSFPLHPPLKQTIVFVEKTTTTDFRGPGMGQHLQYFPAFDLASPQSGLSTDCDGCIESTPDFENFKHHLNVEVLDRTFSPDAGGDPLGVKTAGGFSSWDVFTLPDGTSGLSGTTYDTSVCENTNNFVNQIRINRPDLHDFCLNLITDNTNGTYDPDIVLEARSDTVDLSLEGNPEFDFDGDTDMYTFRYMGMQEGDRIKIRIRDQANCNGAGIAGIMVSHISTCTPPVGTCEPICDGKVCGDDGCGGSCGICPRVDKLEERTGYVSLWITENGSTVTHVDPDVESVRNVGDGVRAMIDDLESSLLQALRSPVTQAANDIDFNVRNHRLDITRHVVFDTVAQADGTLNFTVTLERIKTKFKLKPELDDGSEFHAKVIIENLGVSGNYNPTSGALSGLSLILDPDDVHTDIDGSGGILGTLFDLGDDVGQILSDIFALNGSLFDLLESILKDALLDALEGQLEGVDPSDLNAFNLSALGIIPSTIDIAGVDFAPQIRAALFNPPVGQSLTVTYDDTEPVLVSGTSAIVVRQEAALTVNLDSGHYVVTASLRRTTFPPVLGSIDAYLSSGGEYTVEGWACGEGLATPLDLGLFSDGSAIEVVQANLEVDPAVAQTCGTSSTFDLYGYAMSLAETELVDVTAWENRLSIIAGLQGFEKEIGEVSRTEVSDWLPDEDPVYGFNFHSESNKKNHVADFNGDGMADYMWEQNGGTDRWLVALSNGLSLDEPTPWLEPNQSPNGKIFNQNHLQRLHVADFNGDGKADLMWEFDGWYVALANASGTGFTVSAQPWLADSHPTFGNTYNDDVPKNRVADFNGDGKADYMWEQEGAANDRWIVALSNGNGFNAPQSWLAASASPTGKVFDPNNLDRLFVADFNGDDKADLMWEYGGWYVALANPQGTGFSVGQQPWLSETTTPFGNSFNDNGPKNHVGDFNGDRYVDYMWEQEGSADDAWIVALSFGAGFEAPSIWLESADSPTGKVFNQDHNDRQFVVDMNADYRDDYVFQWNDAWWVSIANAGGTGFESPIRWLDEDILPSGVNVFNESNPSRHYIADFDGDEFPDLLWEEDGWRAAITLLPGTPAPAPPPPPGGGGC